MRMELACLGGGRQRSKSVHFRDQLEDGHEVAGKAGPRAAHGQPTRVKAHGLVCEKAKVATLV